MPRPGGNPDLARYKWEPKGAEGLTATLTLKLAPSMLAKLRQIDGWQDKTRALLAALVAAEQQQQLPGEEIAGGAAAVTGGQGHLGQDAADHRRRTDQVDSND